MSRKNSLKRLAKKIPVRGKVRPDVSKPTLEAAYAKMAKDREREQEAMEWIDITFKCLNPPNENI